MSTQYTPGPWTNHGRIPQPGLPHSAVAAKTLIARVYSEAFGDEAQETANARLIAAAPDMYEALKLALRALNEISHEMTVGERYTNAGQYLIDALAPCATALAKAEGKS